MSNFTPLSSVPELILSGDWVGYIKIDPPLSQEETKYLRSFLLTFHFDDSSDEYNGLYICHKDKELYRVEVVNQYTGKQEHFYRQRQVHVPSLTAPLVLGYLNDSKDVNAIGIKTHTNGIAKVDLWIKFLIEHFFKKDCIAKVIFSDFAFLQEHTLNGEICYSTPFIQENRPRFYNCSVVNNKVYKYVLALPVPTPALNTTLQKSKSFSQKSFSQKVVNPYKSYYLNPFKSGVLPFPVFYAPNFNEHQALIYKSVSTIKSVLNNHQFFQRFTTPDETVLVLDEYLELKYESSLMHLELSKISKTPKITEKPKIVKF